MKNLLHFGPLVLVIAFSYALDLSANALICAESPNNNRTYYSVTLSADQKTAEIEVIYKYHRKAESGVIRKIRFATELNCTQSNEETYVSFCKSDSHDLYRVRFNHESNKATVIGVETLDDHVHKMKKMTRIVCMSVSSNERLY